MVYRQPLVHEELCTCDAAFCINLRGGNGRSVHGDCVASVQLKCAWPAQVTWGHPCCFERARRKAGAPDEDRASFRATVDICRDDWLILHKLEYTEEMRYLGRRLRQCGAVRAVLDRARALAVATAEPLPAYPEHGKVSWLG